MIVGINDITQLLETIKPANAAKGALEHEFSSLLAQVLSGATNQEVMDLDVVGNLKQQLLLAQAGQEQLLELDINEHEVSLEGLVAQLEAAYLKGVAEDEVASEDVDNEEAVSEQAVPNEYLFNVLANLAAFKSEESGTNDSNISRVHQAALQQNVWYSKPSKANEESNFAIKTRIGLVSEPIKQTDLGNMDSSTVINQSTDHGIAVANSQFSQENFGESMVDNLSTAISEDVFAEELVQVNVEQRQKNVEPYQPKLAAGEPLNISRPIFDVSNTLAESIAQGETEEILFIQTSVNSFTQELLADRLQRQSHLAQLHSSTEQVVGEQFDQQLDDEISPLEIVAKPGESAVTRDLEVDSKELITSLGQAKDKGSKIEIESSTTGLNEQFQAKIQPENSVQTASSSTSTPPRLEQSVFQQVVEKMHFQSVGEHHEVRIQLKPDHLGEVKIKLAIEQGIVTAEFVIESQAVKEILSAQLPELRQALQQQGINLGQVDVNLGGNDSGYSDETPRRNVTVVKSKVSPKVQLDLEPAIRTEDSLSQVNLRV